MAKFLAKFGPSAIGGVEGAVRFVLGNKLEIVGEVDKLPEAIREQAMIHGLLQKVGDAAAGFSKSEDFAGAFSAMQQVWDNLESGVWNARGGGGNSDLIAAIARVKKMDVTDAAEIVEAMDEEKLKKVLAHPEVKKAMLEIKAERAAIAAENADDLDDILGS